ncbi:MAG: hypothetical protein U0169_05740 [Polyangiaceae bacterium]
MRSLRTVAVVACSIACGATSTDPLPHDRVGEADAAVPPGAGGAGDSGAAADGASGEAIVALGRRYVEDASFRNDALVRSLVSTTNGYATLRLAKYGDTWSRLPEWNPRARIVSPGDAPSFAPRALPEGTSIDVDAVPWSHDALVDLGRRAFTTYPVQLASWARVALGSEGAVPRAERYGVAPSGGQLGGFVWSELPASDVEIALTCSTCHAAPSSEGSVPGKNHGTLALAAMMADAPTGASHPWPPGTIDVTDDGVDNPVAIPDLRAMRHVGWLHHAATVVNDPVSLAIRIETLIVTSTNQSVRPPRKLAFALSLYLLSLSDSYGTAAPPAPRAFVATCGGCHSGPALGGGRVPVPDVGENSVLTSTERATGFARVPSLLGVSGRTRLFSDGSLPTVRELFEPARGTHHPFGSEFDAGERASVLAFLEGLR